MIIRSIIDPYAVKIDGTTPLTGNWDVGGYDILNVGDLGIGTATPFRGFHLYSDAGSVFARFQSTVGHAFFELLAAPTHDTRFQFKAGTILKWELGNDGPTDRFFLQGIAGNVFFCPPDTQNVFFSGQTFGGDFIATGDSTTELDVRKIGTGLDNSNVTGSGLMGFLGNFTNAANLNYKVEITTGGDIGTAVFRWSDDGGSTWDEEDISMYGPHEMNHGIYVTFSSGAGQDFNANDYATFTAIGTDNQVSTLRCDSTNNAVYMAGTLNVTGLSTLASVDINGGNIDGTTIATSPISGAAGSFTTLAASDAATFDTTATVNAGNNDRDYLTLKGFGAIAGSSGRGGGLEFVSDTQLEYKGYLYFNINKQLVFDSTKQQTIGDAGNAFINCDNGSAQFAGGDLTISSAGALGCAAITESSSSINNFTRTSEITDSRLSELRLIHQTTGVMAEDFAAGLLFQLKGSGPVTIDAGIVEVARGSTNTQSKLRLYTLVDNVAVNSFQIAEGGITRIGRPGTANYAQFAADGDLTFHGTAGLAFAEIYAADVADTIALAFTGVQDDDKAQITSFAANGVSNNCTPDHTNDHITITTAGIYKCNMSMHFLSVGGGGADNYGYSVYKNNGATEFLNLHGQRDLAGGGGDEGSVSVSGLIDLAAPVSNTDTSYAFVDSNPDTLTDSNNQFVADGFLVGQTLTVSGSTSNDGDYTMAAVAAGTITLIATDTLTAEAAGDTVTLTGTETIEVWIWNNTNADDVVIDDINLNLIQIGGT